MRISRHLTLVAALSCLAGPALAFNLGEAASLLSAANGGKSTSDAASLLANPQNLELLQALSALKLTPQQAVGGAGAMLGLAKNQLPSAEYRQLKQSVPGLHKIEGDNGLKQLEGLSGLLGKSATTPLSGAATAALANVNNLTELNQAFSALGMDSGMIGQFAPLLLHYFGQQGVGGPLLSSLGSVWGIGSGA
ncbi:MAG: DUF2780 domain-containing protein [Pseudomonadaceae bacterium]|jgi:hypothetical protein|nr:DUF2780 domain-containing protein [Pseudomonadaceae bacterium]